MSDRNSEAQSRDNRARDRDEAARGRDDLARDRDDFDQARTRAARNVQNFATIVLIIGVAAVIYLITAENRAVEELQETAIRTEEAAVRTEQVLREILAEDRTPESLAFDQAVRQAVRDIRTIKEIVCEVEQAPPDCEE